MKSSDVSIEHRVASFSGVNMLRTGGHLRPSGAQSSLGRPRPGPSVLRSGDLSRLRSRDARSPCREKGTPPARLTSNRTADRTPAERAPRRQLLQLDHELETPLCVDTRLPNAKGARSRRTLHRGRAQPMGVRQNDVILHVFAILDSHTLPPSKSLRSRIRGRLRQVPRERERTRFPRVSRAVCHGRELP